MKKKLLSIILLAFLLLANISYASTTDGTIDSTFKYARFTGDNVGYINFGATNGNVHVTDAGLTGSAWSENYGWIKLDPSNGGVDNDAEGNLSGYAWGERIGWVNFHPTNGGVTIDSSGVFSGYAWSERLGWISFNCATESYCSTNSYKVVTDWRPASVRNAPPPTDVCPNISGTQTSVPSGMTIDGSGNCVATSGGGGSSGGGGDNPPPPPPPSDDVCPNMAGTQTSVPAGMELNAQGNCVPISNADLCPNISGTQTSVPSGMMIDDNNNCVSIPSDSCPNISGIQDGLPLGMEIDNLGNCVPTTPPQDICLNIPDVQTTVPSGMTVDASGNCIIPTDVCPNIAGNQDSIPSGMQYDTQGNCVQGKNALCVGTDCDLSLPFIPPAVIEAIAPQIQAITSVVGSVASSTREVVTQVHDKLADIYKNPNVDVASKAVSTVGIIGAGAVAASALFISPLSMAEIFLIPFRLWGLLLTFLGLKKKHRPWGTVYDSITKQPLDPAYVLLKDAQGKEISTSITDLDGRYGFLASSGTYTLAANKTNYIFPSQQLAGKNADELYNNLYFGEPITIESGGVIDRNIPLDPEHFDWNEFAKKNKNLMRFYSARDKMFFALTDWFFRLGFIVALAALVAAPQPYNLIIAGVYVVLLILRKFGLRVKTYGSIMEQSTGNPLSFAIIRIISPAANREIIHKVADQFGRYYCLVPKGNYVVRIEKKNIDQSYTQVLETAVIAQKGIINQTFKI